MAGDWIKMRGNLWDDPRVSRLCDLTDQSEAAIVGGLYWLWSTADQHTEDGVMPGLTLRQIDRKTGITGFGQALCEIGWLADHPEGVRIVDFEKHNGESAKKRCQTAKRVAKHKAANAEVTHDALPIEQNCVSSALPREEKRREEKKREKEGERDTRGSRLPADWELPDEWRSWAKAQRPDLDPANVAAKFADHWHSKPGVAGRKLDWLATWRNWVREERGGSAAVRSVAAVPPRSFAEQDREVGMRRWEQMTGRTHPDRQAGAIVLDAMPPDLLGLPT